jgi:hypothetical protein
LPALARGRGTEIAANDYSLRPRLSFHILIM